MKRKFLIYIILFFILIFSNNIRVNATDCQYEVSLPNSGYFYLKINYSKQLTDSQNFYYCFSKEKLNSLCGTENKGTFGSWVKSYQAPGMNYDIGILVDYTIFQDFNSNECPNISYHVEDNRDLNFGEWLVEYGLTIGGSPALYYLQFANSSLSTQQSDDYYLLTPQSGTSNGTINTDTCYESDAAIPRAINALNSNFCTKKNGKKYWKLQEGTNAIKKCDYKLVKIPGTNSKGIKCSYTFDELGTLNFYVLEEEAEKIWSGNVNGLKIENVEGRYYWTFLSNSNVEKYLDAENIDTALNIYSISSVCADKNVKTVVKLIGYLLIILKIFVPILLIGLGVKSLVQTIISGKQEDLQKAAIGLMWKFIAAVIIFVLPTIINFIVGLISGATDGTSDYNTCRTCIFEPGKC